MTSSQRSIPAERAVGIGKLICFVLILCLSSSSNSRSIGGAVTGAPSSLPFASAFAPQHSSPTRRRRVRPRPQRPTSSARGDAAVTKARINNYHDGDESQEEEEEEGAQSRKTRMVWLTGSEDLRLRDHGGFAGAAFSDDDDGGSGSGSVTTIVPVFVLDERMHLRSRSTSQLKRLHASLSALERRILSSSSSSSPLSTTTKTSSSTLLPLVVRSGTPSSVLPALAREYSAASCHVVADDVVDDVRAAQREACAALEDAGVEVARWSDRLRPTAPWSSSSSSSSAGAEDAGGGGKPKAAAAAALPSFWDDYRTIVDGLPVAAPIDGGSFDDDGTGQRIPTEEGGESAVPSLNELLDLSKAATPAAVLEARSSRLEYRSTSEPFEDLILHKEWSTEEGAAEALEEYRRVGSERFADEHFDASRAANGGASPPRCETGRSAYAASIARLMPSGGGSSKPSDVLALREGPTRAFSPALGLGAVSARCAYDAAGAGAYGAEQFWGRSSEGSLSDVVEWREWFRLLAERSLALQEAGAPGTSGGEKISARNENNLGKDGDPREGGTVRYWRWKGQYLVRYLTFPAGKDYDAQDEAERDPALMLVHGFAASAEQWERLVHSLREQSKQANGGKDTTPPVYAVDLLGFGHSEKPGLSYTQYLWESQLVDFAMEVMEATPMVMVGNSIGGGLSAGAAASLGKTICKGLVLLNTAGVLEDPDAYDGYNPEYDSDAEVDYRNIRSHTEAAIEGNPEKTYQPVPLVGNKALDVFGSAIVGLIYPQIEKRLSLIYGNRMENADPSAVYAIQQSASHPGSANVIGSGQKLAPNRPLNEVLMGVGEDEEEGEDGQSAGFPTLVVIGLNDQVSSPPAAQARFEMFSKLSLSSPETVTVEAISDSGHCPHDETPEKVASAMRKWFESTSF